MAENFGVAGRGKFYEEAGAIRDVVQNHMLQLVALLAMEPPCEQSVEAARDEKARVFKAMRPLDPLLQRTDARERENRCRYTR